MVIVIAKVIVMATMLMVMVIVMVIVMVLLLLLVVVVVMTVMVMVVMRAFWLLRMRAVRVHEQPLRLVKGPGAGRGVDVCSVLRLRATPVLHRRHSNTQKPCFERPTQFRAHEFQDILTALFI